MNAILLLFSLGLCSILFLPSTVAACTENDKQIIKSCYTSHFAIYNHTMPVYYWILANFVFNSTNESSTFCTNFGALQDCIGEERYATCVTPDSLQIILDKTWSESRDLIYIYRRRQIFCSWLPQLLSTNISRSTILGCFQDMLTSVCGYKNVIRRPTSDCKSYQHFVECYAGWQVYYCSMAFVYMRCEMLDLHVRTYQQHCNFATFDCKSFDYTAFLLKIKTDTIAQSYLVLPLIIISTGIMVKLFYCQRILFSTIYIAIFCSMFKQKSPLKSSFFAIFLMVPLYDVFWIITYLLRFFKIERIYIFGFFQFRNILEENYVDYMTGVLFFMSLNRFTAINFALRHKRIWSLPVVCFSLLVILMLVFLFQIIFNSLLAWAKSTDPVKCFNQIDDPMANPLVCYFNSLDNGDWIRELDTGKIKAYICFGICFMCFVPLMITSIRYRCISKHASSTLINAEKRLLIITIVEVTAMITYNVVYHSSAIMGKEYLTTIFGIINMYHTVLLFFHHLLSMLVFFIFSKAIRNAFFEFYFLDVLYAKTIKKYFNSSTVTSFAERNVNAMQIIAPKNSKQIPVR